MHRASLLRHLLRCCRSLDAITGVDATCLLQLIPPVTPDVAALTCSVTAHPVLQHGIRACLPTIASIDSPTLLYLNRCMNIISSHARDSLTPAAADLSVETTALASSLRPVSTVQVLTPGVLAVSPVSDTTSTARKVVLLYDISREGEATTWTARGLHVNLPLFKSVSTSTDAELGPLGTLDLNYGGAPPSHPRIRTATGLYLLHTGGHILGTTPLDSDDAPVEVVSAGRHGVVFGADLNAFNAALTGGSLAARQVKVLLHACEFELTQDESGALDAGVLEPYQLLAGPGIADLIFSTASADAIWTAAVHAASGGGRRGDVYPSLDFMRQVKSELASVPFE